MVGSGLLVSSERVLFFFVFFVFCSVIVVCTLNVSIFRFLTIVIVARGPY